MAMTKRPANTVETFIKKAPDATAQPKGMTTGNQSQISLAMPRELLDKVDAAAIR